MPPSADAFGNATHKPDRPVPEAGQVPGPNAAGSEAVYRWDGPPRLELWRGPVQLPGGHAYLGHALHAGAGVVIVATRANQLLLVLSARPATGHRLWELPRGFADPDRPPAQEALRELKEETGLCTSGSSGVQLLGQYWTDTALLPTQVSVVHCVVRDHGQVSTPDGEVADQAWVWFEDLPRMVADGVLADAHSLAALSLARAVGTFGMSATE